MSARPIPCNPDRFIERVFTDEAFDRPLCRCCGRWLGRTTVAHDAGDMDGYCRWCELLHPDPLLVERPKLFAR